MDRNVGRSRIMLVFPILFSSSCEPFLEVALRGQEGKLLGSYTGPAKPSIVHHHRISTICRTASHFSSFKSYQIVLFMRNQTVQACKISSNAEKQDQKNFHFFKTESTSITPNKVENRLQICHHIRYQA